MVLLFLDLPLSIQSNIIYFLPQDSLINLALTNFQLYKPCLKKLYKRIIIQYDPILKNDPNHRKNDFLDSSHTVVYGMDHGPKVFSLETHLRLVAARLTVLNESLKINPELVTYIEDINIMLGDNTSHNDQFKQCKPIMDNLHILIANLKGHSMTRFFVDDYQLRSHLDLKNIILNSIVVDDLDTLDAINTQQCHELLVSLSTNSLRVPKRFSFKSLTSLILTSDETKYWQFVNHVLRPDDLSNLNTFKLVFNSDIKHFSQNVELVNSINWAKIRNLEILVGCDPHKVYDLDDTQDFVIDCLNLIPVDDLYNVEKLSVVQSFTYDTHVLNEEFDINIFNFVQSIVGVQAQQETKSALKYFSLIHKVPLQGNFDDGLEGNYLRRMKLYSDVLPKILMSPLDGGKQSKVNIILPNFFQTVACYDQPMNNMLWNGCKCKHCQEYLGYLDEYLMYHKYYDSKLQTFRDLNSSVLFTTIASQLSQRMVHHELMTHLYHLAFPLTNRLWNFHDSLVRVPFRCYDIQMIDQGEFDGEEEHEYFDTHETTQPCKFNNSIYNSGIPISMSHYLDDLIMKIINLNRGDAEAFDLGLNFKDGGDTEELQLNITKMIVNGVNYDLDKELNGTNFFENVYDHV